MVGNTWKRNYAWGLQTRHILRFGLSKVLIMEHLFFNFDGSLPEAAKQFFASIGLSNYQEGHSANALGGTYNSASAFGMLIRIEGNTYDFEDDYQYMVSIKKDVLSSLKVDKLLLQGLALIVARMLSDNQRVPVARETPKGLEIIEPHE